MPIFEYQCRRCGAVFETLVGSAATQVACESCGSAQVGKLLSTFSAGVARRAPAPCSGGGCPSPGLAGTGCSGGGCPYS